MANTLFTASYPYIRCLNPFKDDASLHSAERPFQDLAPLNEKDFCPFLEFFFGNLRSVAVFLRFLEVSWDVFVKRLHMYCGASSCRDLKTIILDSLAISSSMVFQPSFLISGWPGVSKLLPVTIRAARFCNFCSWLISVTPQQPQTEQQ